MPHRNGENDEIGENGENFLKNGENRLKTVKNFYITVILHFNFFLF